MRDPRQASTRNREQPALQDVERDLAGRRREEPVELVQFPLAEADLQRRAVLDDVRAGRGLGNGEHVGQPQHPRNGQLSRGDSLLRGQVANGPVLEQPTVIDG